ncbi:hypothetical protein [Jiangella asiatica]|uniref:Uncharacterized protein n=1 Tax=Jiangella asiatica TaxID=2530372 RepID=A0A4R5DA11_9ACTN|nr:hypothetical protein [Jiangella asiatica]TDE10409.1 hypothetical protein E1269_12005 [Jiangella asiatica]
MTGHRSGRRLLPRSGSFSAVLFSGVLMILSGALVLLSAALPAAAGQGSGSRGSAVEVGGGAEDTTAPPAAPSVDGVDERAGTVTVTAPTGKLGYAPPAAAGTEVDPLDLFTLGAGDGRGDDAPAEVSWAATDPDRGPPANRQ